MSVEYSLPPAVRCLLPAFLILLGNAPGGSLPCDDALQDVGITESDRVGLRDAGRSPSGASRTRRCASQQETEAIPDYYRNTRSNRGTDASRSSVPPGRTRRVSHRINEQINPAQESGHDPIMQHRRDERMICVPLCLPQDLTTQVQWSSDNPNIAKVDAMGTVTGESPGTATITATLNGVTQSFMVTIGAPTPIGITVQPAPASRASGASVAPGSSAPTAVPTGR